MYNLVNYLAQVVETHLTARKLQFFVVTQPLLPTLLADFKDPIQNWDRVELDIANSPSILFL